MDFALDIDAELRPRARSNRSLGGQAGDGLARRLDGFEQDDQIAVRMPLGTARLGHVPIEKQLHRLAPPLVGDEQCRNTWLARTSSAEMLYNAARSTGVYARQ
jgi:hypothetical protein